MGMDPFRFETSGEWREIERKLLAKLDTTEARVGILASKGGQETHPDSKLTMLEIASVHEFGSPAANIPQRSFIRSTFENVRAEFAEVAAKAVFPIMRGAMSVEKALEILGLWGENAVKKHMVKGDPSWPKLAKSTIARRKRLQRSKRGIDKPLIDTGRLRQAVSSIVSHIGGGE